eukprot:gene23864-62721_t
MRRAAAAAAAAACVAASAPRGAEQYRTDGAEGDTVRDRDDGEPPDVLPADTAAALMMTARPHGARAVSWRRALRRACGAAYAAVAEGSWGRRAWVPPRAALHRAKRRRREL